MAPRAVELRGVEVPEPAHGQLLVRTLCSGISAGTELLAYRGDIDPDLALDESLGALTGNFRYPFRYGYSCVGRIERSRDAGVPEGALVFAFHPHQDRFLVTAGDVVRLDRVEPRAGTLFPLVETALQVTLDAGPVLEQPVVVVGLGVLGILSAAMLQRAGARVVGAEPRTWRREAAQGFGVPAVSPEELADTVAEVTDGRGVPLVVEVTGDPAALAGALPLLGHEGTALVASWYGSRTAPLPLGADFHRRRLSIRSTQVSTIPSWQSASWTVERRRAVARRLLGELPLHALATHAFPLADAAAAYAAVDRGEPGLLHAALCYG